MAIMARVRVDAQGRLVLPQSLRRRFGIDGRPAELVATETADGLLIELPPNRAILSQAEDGLPEVTIEGLSAPITNDSVIAGIDADRARR